MSYRPHFGVITTSSRRHSSGMYKYDFSKPPLHRKTTSPDEHKNKDDFGGDLIETFKDGQGIGTSPLQ